MLLERSAEVTVCSTGLQKSKGSRRCVRLIPNAVDVDRYRIPRERPPDLPAGRIALYVGTVHPDRMDFGLCERIARELSRTGSGSLVLVGPIK